MKVIGRAYDETISNYFVLGRTSLVMKSAALANHVTITYLRFNGPDMGVTKRIPPDPALLLAAQLKTLLKQEIWLDGRHIPVSP